MIKYNLNGEIIKLNFTLEELISRSHHCIAKCSGKHDTCDQIAINIYEIESRSPEKKYNDDHCKRCGARWDANSHFNFDEKNLIPEDEDEFIKKQIENLNLDKIEEI